MWSTDCAQPNWSRHRRHGIENKRAYKCNSTGAAQSQDASDGVTRFYRHDCQSGGYPCATQSRWKMSLEQDFQMSAWASLSWNALDILFLLTASLSNGEPEGWGGGGAFTLERGEGSSLNTVVSPFSTLRALKGLYWVEWVRGWGALLSTINVSVFQGAIGAMVDQFIILVDVPDGWMGKRRIKCHFLLSSDP